MKANCTESVSGPESVKLLSTLYVTQWFAPEPVRVPVGIARSLRDRNHDVQILTGLPNYPHGRLHEGYSSWRGRRESTAGFAVRRTPLFASHDSSALNRVLNYLSWSVSASVLSFRLFRSADVALVYSSPATAAIPALIWKRATNTPFVLLIQDLWPDTITAAKFISSPRIAAVVHRCLSIFTKWTYRSASHIAVISPGMLEVLVERGVPRSKLSLVYNWTESRDSDALPTAEHARKQLGILPDAFLLTYAGSHGVAQGLETVLEAACLVRDRPEICFFFFGDGVERKRLERLADSFECDNVRFMGVVSEAEMMLVRAASDVQLVCLADDDLFRITMPSKVQGILASASPIIAVADGDAAQVVIESGAGWTVSPGNASALADRVVKASEMATAELDAMGRSGLEYYDKFMSERIGGDLLDVILRRAARDFEPTVS